MKQFSISAVLVASFATVLVAIDANLSIADDQPGETRAPVKLTEPAKKLHASMLLFDGHNDLPWQFRKRGLPSFDKLDISQPQPELQSDIPRLRQGGVGAQFWSVYVDADTALSGTSLMQTMEQIDFVHAMIRRYPETFELALSTADVERIRAAGKIASLLGVEGGHSIQDSLGVLRQLYQLGVRYMTLTHSATLSWADSATDEAKHQGLTPFGEAVVRQMNELGMLVDLSHVSVDTMKDALQVSKAPVIFSHSSARAIADHPRNVPDDVLRLTAQNGGVVMVNFYSAFVVAETAQRSQLRQVEADRLEKEIVDETERDKAIKRWEAQHPPQLGTLHDVVDHIDHIVQVAGIDHVGIGSDFDGVDMLPMQLESVATYPYITQELLNRGYTETEIRKISGRNMLRAFRRAEQVASAMKN